MAAAFLGAVLQACEPPPPPPPPTTTTTTGSSTTQSSTTTTTASTTTTTAVPTPPLPPVPPDQPPPDGSPALDVDEAFVTGLSRPWDMGFLADGTMFFTLRDSGEVRVRFPDGTMDTVVHIEDSFELMGLAVDPNFTAPTGTAGRRSIYTCFAADDNVVKVVRWTLNATSTGVVSLRTILRIPWGGPFNIKNGCRIRFRPDTDELWITTGDAHVGTNPQNLSSWAGKVLRVTRSGAAYPGNPFGTPVYTFGHRNGQGLAFQPETNAVYATDHGPDADDEVNRLGPGGNSGWDPGPGSYPAGFGAGVSMTDLGKFPGAMLPAWRSGSSTIAPSGATFLSGAQWGSWNGALAVATLKGSHIRLMFFEGGNDVVYTASVLAFGVRLRSAVQGPDGNLYISTDVADGGGAIWKVTPG